MLQEGAQSRPAGHGLQSPRRANSQGRTPKDGGGEVVRCSQEQRGSAPVRSKTGAARKNR